MSAAIPDPNDPAILSAAYTHPPFPRLDDETLALLEEMRDFLASLLGLPVFHQDADRPAQPVRRPLVETAPGDHRLAKIGYVLVRIDTDPITGLDTIWYWQRLEEDAAPAVQSEPQP